MRKNEGMMQGLVATSGTAIASGLPDQSIGAVGADIFGLFNIFVGLMLVAAILAYAGGLIVWTVLLGVQGRSQGIHIMEWGVAILFVLVVLLAIVQYFTSHPDSLTFLIGIVVALFIGWVIIQVIKGGGEKKEE